MTTGTWKRLAFVGGADSSVPADAFHSLNEVAKGLDLLPSAVVIVGAGGEIVYVNYAAQSLFGYAQAELLNRPIEALVPSEFRGEHAAKVSRFLSTQDRRVMRGGQTVWGRHKDGSNIFVEVGLSSIELGKRRFVICSLHDARASKKAELRIAISEARYREAQRVGKIGSWEWDLTTNEEWWSDEFYALVEEDRATYPSSFPNFLTKVHPEDRRGIAEAVANTSNHDAVSPPFEIRLLFPGGREKHLAGRVETRVDSDGNVVAIVGTMHDVTEWHSLREQLEEMHERYTNTVRLAAIGIVHVAPDGTLLDANEKFCEMLGYSRDELVGMSVAAISHPDDRLVADEPRRQLHLGAIDALNVEKRYLRKDGAVIWARITAAIYRGDDGKPLYDIAVVEDVSHRKLVEARIEYLATYDQMTGLPNRAAFSAVLDRELAAAKDSRQRLALLFIDIDRFKVINDSLGHEAGDLLLKEMGTRLPACLRPGDVITRFGGDEFVVLLKSVHDREEAVFVAERILGRISEPVEIHGKQCAVSASIGIGMFPGDAQDAAELLRCADSAMYRAKRQGRNVCALYVGGSATRSLQRFDTEMQLRSALERDEFHLRYQPRIDVRTGEIAGVEALLRWRNSVLGDVAPSEFIPLAEVAGLIVPIGLWVLETACEQVATWSRRGNRPMLIAVNVSLRQLQDPSFVLNIASVLQRYDIDPRLVELEITESIVIDNIDELADKLTAIKKIGVKIALDDFGSGYTSLTHLKRLPIDTLKMDRSFIQDVPGRLQDKLVTQAVISMGRTLGVTVVAEGVERKSQYEFLRDCGCDQVQGYFFGMPYTADEYADLLVPNIHTASG